MATNSEIWSFHVMVLINLCLKLRQLAALAFLNENEIPDAFNRLVQLIPPMARLVIWFAKIYVIGNRRRNTPPRFTPLQWSVAENNNHEFPRTQNHVEAFHRHWNSFIKSHTGTFNFIEKIREQRDNEALFVRIEIGEPRKKIPPKDVLRERRLNTIFTNRANNQMPNDMVFIRSIAHNLRLY